MRGVVDTPSRARSSCTPGRRAGASSSTSRLFGSRSKPLGARSPTPARSASRDGPTTRRRLRSRAGSFGAAAALPDALKPRLPPRHLVSSAAVAGRRGGRLGASVAVVRRRNIILSGTRTRSADPKRRGARLRRVRAEPRFAPRRQRRRRVALHARTRGRRVPRRVRGHAPAPESAVDALLDVAELERVMGEALASALRAKNEIWTRAVARAAAADALAA